MRDAPSFFLLSPDAGERPGEGTHSEMTPQAMRSPALPAGSLL